MSFKNNEQIKEYLNDIFFETGTYHGDCVRKAQEVGFRRVITVDNSDQRYNEAIRLSEDFSEIEFFLDESTKIIEVILKDLNDEKITFWLDAHPPGFCDEITWPVFDELRTIATWTKRKDHVILIDDMRLFTENQKDKLKELIHNINKDYVIELIEGSEPNDIMLATIKNN